MWELETGKYYKLDITSDGNEEIAVVAPELFRNSWINQIVVNDLEVKSLGLYSVEFDDAGTFNITFVPIRPGEYEIYVPGFVATVAALMAASAVPRAVAKGTGMIFVSTEKGNEVVVLDQALAVVKRIATSRRPRDMHFNAAKDMLYVACGDDDAIDVIDVATLEVVDSIPTGPSPEVFAFSPDEKVIYVSNEEDSRLEAIDMETRVSVQDIPTGAEPEGVLVMPDGKTAYVTSEVADMVHVVDTATGAVTKNILVGTRPRRFILTPDQTELWVCCELSSEIYIIDTATNEIKGDSLIFVPPGFREEDVTPVGMAVTRDGSKILLSPGARQPHRDHRRQDPRRAAICAGGEARVVGGSVERRKPGLCGERAFGRHHGDRHGVDEADPVGAGRPRAAFGGDR